MKKTMLFVGILLVILITAGFWVSAILSKEIQQKSHHLGVESLAAQLDHIIR